MDNDHCYLKMPAVMISADDIFRQLHQRCWQRSHGKERSKNKHRQFTNVHAHVVVV